MKLILGSGSKSRRQVLEKAGYAFDVLVADIDEKAIRHADAQALVLALGHAKADAIIPKITEPCLLVTGDQVVVCGDVIFEKPADANEARTMIRSYQNHPMQIVNSLVVTNTKTGKSAGGVDSVTISFKPITEEAIEEAIAIGKIMDCAGAMRVEEKPFCDFVDYFDGTEESASGMPLELLKRLLSEVE